MGTLFYLTTGLTDLLVRTGNLTQQSCFSFRGHPRNTTTTTTTTTTTATTTTRRAAAAAAANVAQIVNSLLLRVFFITFVSRRPVYYDVRG